MLVSWYITAIIAAIVTCREWKRIKRNFYSATCAPKWGLIRFFPSSDYNMLTCYPNLIYPLAKPYFIVNLVFQDSILIQLL